MEKTPAPASRRGKVAKWLVVGCALLLVGPLAWQFPLGREGIIRAAGKLGGPVALVRRGLHDPDHYVRRSTFTAFRDLGERAAPALIGSLEDESADVRAEAAEALYLIGAPAHTASAALIKALHDPDPRVRGNAARALWRVDPDATDALPTLLEMLEDAEGDVRAHATEAVGVIGRDDSTLLPRIIRMLQDPEASVRAEAAEALGRRRAAARAALPDLQKLLREDPSPQVRKEVIEALMKIDPDHPPGPADARSEPKP